MAVYKLFPPPTDEYVEDEDSQAAIEIVTNQKKKQLLGLVGAGLLAVGVFMPIVSIPIVGSINYLYNGRGDGIIILALALLSGILILCKRLRGLIVAGFLSLAVMGFTLCLFFARINNLKDDLAKSDNIFKGLGQAIMATVQIQWGWVPLVAGGFLVLAAGLLKDELRDSAGHIIPVKQTRAWSVMVVTGCIMTAAMTVSSFIAPSFLRGVDVPSFTTNKTANLLASVSDAPKAEAAETKESSVKGWQYNEKMSEMDGKKTAVLYLMAENKIPGLISEARPSMFIRCQNEKPELYISTEVSVEYEGIYSSGNKVRVRFDNQGPVQQRWEASTDRQALFAPNASQLIKQLSSTDVFLFEFTPYNKGAQTVRFNVAGLSNQLTKIAQACPKSKL